MLCAGDAVWLRNQVVAPVTEELVFRGAMLPMLVPCMGPTAAIFMAPLFFGVGMETRFQGCAQLIFLFTLFDIDLVSELHFICPSSPFPPYHRATTPP